MQEIVNAIEQAELKAAEIKENAQSKGASIVENAEERAAEILKLSEVECRNFREKALKDAEEDAQKKYEEEIKVKRAEGAKYASSRLAASDNVVSEIVRRVVRGNR